uniref:Lipase domain-containing protein n=2 Tax=Callorhinchus milii TaxID=7868 RepID=A0A4W3HEL5_CALMI
MWLLACWILPFLRCVASEPVEEECPRFTELSVTDTLVGTELKVRLLLYTRANETCPTLITANNLGPMNLTKKVVFLIHGYRPFGSKPKWLSKMVKSLLDVEDINLIVVDWNRGATTINYIVAAGNTKKLAVKLKPVVDRILTDTGSLDSVHMIGVSLGAHAAGFVGSMFHGKIGQITGLDPAGPQFTNTPPEERLDPTDAKFVAVLHTDMDALGFREVLGHIDYYPNGGKDQPGCPATILKGKAYVICDHQRSVYLYMSSMSSCNFTVYPCPSYKQFLNGECMVCNGTCPIFGYHAKPVTLSQSAVYFLTASSDPFCTHSYMMDIIAWNQNAREGYLTIELTGDSATVTSDVKHVSKTFERFQEISLLVNVDKDPGNIRSVSLTYTSTNWVEPKLRFGLLRMRLRSLTFPDRPHKCRYDVILHKRTPVTFQPLDCQDLQM